LQIETIIRQYLFFEHELPPCQSLASTNFRSSNPPMVFTFHAPAATLTNHNAVFGFQDCIQSDEIRNLLIQNSQR